MEETVNQKVAKCRRMAGLSQSQVAEKLGMKASTYSQMERSGNISIERVIRLSEIFGIPLSELVGISEKEGSGAARQTDTPSIFDQIETPRAHRLRDSGVYFEEPLDFGLENRLKIRDKNMIKMYVNFSERDKLRVCEFVKGIYDEKKSKDR